MSESTYPLLPITSSWEMLLVYIKRRRYVRVKNDSMVPTLNPGDVVVLDEGAYRRRQPCPGDIIVAQHPQPGQPRLIKRVQSVVDERGNHGVDLVATQSASMNTRERSYFLASDNADLPESRDSRHYGLFSADAIIGRVTSKLRQ